MNIKQEYMRITAPRSEVKIFLNKIRFTFKNPLAQFGLLGVILIVFQILSLSGSLSNATTNAIGYVMIYGIASIGFCLLLGYSGLASLGTAGFIGVGIYLSYYALADWHVTILPALLVAGIVSIVLGIIVGFVSLRIEGIYLAIMTLCLSEVVVRLLKAIESGTIRISSKDLTFFGLPLSTEVIYIIIAVVLVVLLVLTANLIKSPTGRAMQAMKSSTSAAQAMGISLMKYRLLAFIIATLFATIAGCFYIFYIGAITSTTSTILTLSMSLNILGAVIIGGAKSLWGTLFGTLFVFGLQDLFLMDIPFFVENPAITTIFVGILMILVVMFFPGGFAQIVLLLRVQFYKLKQKWKVRKYGLQD